MSKHDMIFELLSQDDNSDNLVSWAGDYLGTLSRKSVEGIYKREIGEDK